MTIGTVDIRPTAIACQVSDDVGATRRISASIIKVDATPATFASAIVVRTYSRQSIWYELVFLLAWNMIQVEVLVLEVKFPSQDLAGECHIDVCEVHIVRLEYEVPII